MSKAGIQILVGVGALALSVILWYWGGYFYDETFRDAVRAESRWVFPRLPGTTAQRAAVSTAVLGCIAILSGLARS